MKTFPLHASNPGIHKFFGGSFLHMCLFMWRARWSDLENALSHRWHWKGLCPVCLR